MTIVRRPLRLAPEMSDENSHEDNVSKPARLKAETTKRYLEDHFIQKFQEVDERKQRWTRITNCDYANTEQKEEVMRRFQLEETEFLRMKRIKMKVERFEKIKKIGQGGTGEVWLVQDRITSELFALKILQKNNIIMQDQLVNVRTERDIMIEAANPWVVQLHYSFQDADHLYLVMTYVPGGDLMAALIRLNKFQESFARFFVGEILLALYSLHSQGILHRDLKPDNVLINNNGHILLADFGLSEKRTTDTKTSDLLEQIQEEMLERTFPGRSESPHHVRGGAIGTIDYTAPEVLMMEEATAKSDYWSLGVILYEMLFGFPPFKGKSRRETALRIANWKVALSFPASANVSKTAIDLIRHLLCNSSKRYGFEDIIKHPFFDGFNFSDPMKNKPPMIPSIRFPTDTIHFDDFEAIEESSQPDAFGSLTKFAFLGFTYRQRPSSVIMN